MAVRLATATRNALAAAFLGLSPGGMIRVYTGPQPASSNDAASGTLLAEFDLGTPSFVNVDGVMTLQDTPIETVGLADGNAGWFRMLSSSAATVYDGNVADGDITLASPAISTGITVRMTAGTVVVPSGE